MTRRTKLGILVLLLFAASGLLKLFESSSPLAEESFGACLRFGIILGAFWLAYPDLVRLPIWIYPAVVLLALAAIKFKLLLFAVPPVLFLGWLLRPRNPAGSRRG
jgi:hypothetical protein